VWIAPQKELVALNIIVCTKQVMDPEIPSSAFRVDQETRKVIPAQGIPPVVNGFDEQAIEAALRLKETHGAEVTVLAMGSGFTLDVIKKPLSMGADQLILLQDDLFENVPDAFFVASVLATAIKKIDQFDLILCGRQASDWDMAHVPLGIAELLGLPVITIAKKVDVQEGKVVVERVLSDGHEVAECSLPALVTVSNELGEPRYPSLRGIMAASRKQPTVWTAGDLGINPGDFRGELELTNLFIPVTEKNVEIVKGEDDADSGRQLAIKMREAKLI